MKLNFNWRRAVVVAAIVALATAGIASAQQFGALYGVVTDENGQPLPGVTVTLEGMGAPRVTVTDEVGRYRFPGLDPGSYYVKAELDGFSTVEQPNVVVALNRNTTINFTLSSAVEDVITVTSESPLLDERRLAQGANISQVELEKIPTARDPWSVMNQAPGVLVDRINVGGNESGQQSVFLGLGTTMSENDFLVDGVQIT
ncbi:MAG: carboxypeptidase-like regulatory domain-containing protein, partial [Thermoanaerobaculia bacterium]|nr:carboxypeptidase-like regulatory domain-containing protein [Thermoanaerobaculia bacterium]